MRKYLALFCAIILAVLLIPNANLAMAISKIDPVILTMQDSEIIPVLIRLEGDPVIATVTSEGLYTTTPRELMKQGNLSTNISISMVNFQQERFLSVSKTIPGLKLGYRLQYTTNGFTAKIPVSSVFLLAKLKNVKFIAYLAPQELHRKRSGSFVGYNRVWSDVKDPSGKKVEGNGVVVAVADTGLDYTHQDFGKQSKPEDRKVVISRDLGEGDRDCQEIKDASSGPHGTACAGIIAADGPNNERGVAPKALLAGYKISNSQGLSGEGIVAAWEFMVKDKVDVSNNSYGAPGGSSYMAESQNNVVRAGVIAVCSQGNEGAPGPNLPIPSGTTASPENVIGVGATDDRDVSKLTIAGTPDGEGVGVKYSGEWGVTGKTFKNYDIAIEVIDCGWGRPQDFEGIDVTGKIALVQRGPAPFLNDKFGPSTFFKDKNLNCQKAGAVLMLLYNWDAGRIGAAYVQGSEKVEDFNFIPAFHLLRTQGENIKSLLHNGHEWELGTPDKSNNKVTLKISSPAPYANMASFSSNGPTAFLHLKPDVSAPGEGIHTTKPLWDKAYGPENYPYTEGFNGTSAAGPFVAGCAALVRQGRPNWSPLEVKRSLMNTATLLRRVVDDNYVPLVAQGQGRVQVYDAVTSDLLFQPPSALIIPKDGRITCDDWPEEWIKEDKKSNLPADVRNSMFAFKISNYNTTNALDVDLSYEINSRNPDAIDVKFSDDSLTIPKSDRKNPGISWVGVNFTFGNNLEGFTNDIIIWAKNKKTGKSWHVGICVYTNQNPKGNTYASAVTVKPADFTPNGDNKNEKITVEYDLTNGRFSNMSGAAWSTYDNYGYEIIFYAIDSNGEKWSKIHEESFVELGPHKFEWDGKDTDGNYFLPDGEWYLGLTSGDQYLDTAKRAMVSSPTSVEFFKTMISISESTIPPLPTITGIALPLEPGAGQEFNLGIYVQYAKNIKSIRFKLNLKGSEGVVKYMGYEVGEFMQRNEPNLVASADYNEKDNSLFVDLQRPLDGISGDGYLVNIRLLAEEANYFDINFSNVEVTMVEESDEGFKEVKAKAFFKRAEISIYNDAYKTTDFNKDKVVDKKDLQMLLDCLGSKKGDTGYNWRCDLNFDRIIDLSDLTIFAQDYIP